LYLLANLVGKEQIVGLFQSDIWAQFLNVNWVSCLRTQSPPTVSLTISTHTMSHTATRLAPRFKIRFPLDELDWWQRHQFRVLDKVKCVTIDPHYAVVASVMVCSDRSKRVDSCVRAVAIHCTLLSW